MNNQQLTETEQTAILVRYIIDRLQSAPIRDWHELNKAACDSWLRVWNETGIRIAGPAIRDAVSKVRKGIS